MRKVARSLKQATRPKLFDLEPDAKHDTRDLIKACIRSGYAFTPIAQTILKSMLEDVRRYGRLPAPQYRLLLVFARRCGVMP
jgi:hypothetical protein